MIRKNLRIACLAVILVALSVPISCFAEENLGDLLSVLSRVQALIKEEHWQEAETELKTAERNEELLARADCFEITSLYSNLAEVLNRQGKDEEARQYSQLALSVLEKNKPVSGGITETDSPEEILEKGGILPAGKGNKSIDLNRLGVLSGHVISTGREGHLSSTGLVKTTPAKIDSIFNKIENTHAQWAQQGMPYRHIVLFAHGGLTSERAAIQCVNQHLELWHNHKIYPIYFAWKSGLSDVLRDTAGWTIDGLELDQDDGASFQSDGAVIPALNPDLADNLIEAFAKQNASKIWAGMKVKAIRACSNIPEGINWTKVSTIPRNLPGGTLTVRRLKEYAAKYPRKVKIHLVAHSAGSIFCAGLAEQLAAEGIEIDSVTLLAPAITINDFRSYFLPQLAKGTLKRMFIFSLSDERERRDKCIFSFLTYNKSLLYLVSRALEPEPSIGSYSEIPLLGLSKWFSRSANESSPPLRNLVSDYKVEFISTPPDGSPQLCDAKTHGRMIYDKATLSCVMSKILK